MIIKCDVGGCSSAIEIRMPEPYEMDPTEALDSVMSDLAQLMRAGWRTIPGGYACNKHGDDEIARLGRDQ